MRILIAYLLFTTLLFSVELQLDTVYEGPKKLTVSSLGISMGVPTGWKAAAKKDQGLLLYQDDSNDTIHLRAKQLNKQVAYQFLSLSHYAGTVKLQPQDSIQQINAHTYSRSYDSNGDMNRPAYRYYVILGPQSRSVVMLSKYDKNHVSAINATTLNIVQALTFTPTKQLQNTLQDLEQRLKGAHMAYLKRDGAYDDKREIWLCSNGRYGLIENRTVAGGMSRVKEQKLGRWSVAESKLILQGDDGIDRIIVIERKGVALFFDGYRSYALKNNQCR